MPENDHNTRFGLWLKARRKALGLSRRELSIRANCSEVTIVKIEGGQRRPSVQIAEHLAQALGIPPDEHRSFIELARNDPTGWVALPEGLPGEDRATREQVDPREAQGQRPTVNLPSPLTSFVGREETVAAAHDLLRRPDIRLLSVTGPPGIGKTRLTLRLAEDASPDFGDGVYFVGLSSLRDPNLVAGTIAGNLGIREREGATPAEELKEYLSSKTMLLVLDNFEQLIPAAPLLGDLLSGSSRLKIVVSSREALRIYGEQNFPLYPLSLPAQDDGLPLQELARYGAIHLFVDRASAVDPHFALTEENAAPVLEICQALQGIPLAIELAAARTWDLALEEIRLGLGRKLTLLIEGPRDLPERQQTLRGAIDWSYDLLSLEERLLLRRMSVFVGGCSVGAVAAICDLQGQQRQEMDLQATLRSLVDKSLLQRESGGPDQQPRLTMLETIREYALERLLASGEKEAEDLRRRHAEYYLALAEEAEPHLEAREGTTWLERLEPEHGNLRAVLDHIVDAGKRPGHIEVALRMGGALERFWEMRGYVSEGRRYLDLLLDKEAEESKPVPAARAKALRAAGRLALYQGDLTTARALYEERVAIERDAGEPSSIASALNDLGVVTRAAADYHYARTLYEESLRIRRELGDRPGIASSLNSLGTLALAQGDYSHARSLAEESLAIRRELGSVFGIALSVHNLGEIERALGNFDAAQQLYSENLRLSEEMEDKPGIANALHNLGQVARHGGEWERAGTLLMQALSLYREWKDRPGIAECLAALAELAVSEGSPESASILFGAVSALIEATNFHFSPPDQSEYELSLSLARSRLGEESFERWMLQGRRMRLEDVVAYALEARPGDGPDREGTIA